MRKRVLVVDDEDTIRGVIEQVLTDDGYEVIEASSGEEALDEFRREPCDLVVTDIYMGKMTGLELLKEIKILRQEAIVVVMTSNASLETAMSALRSGAYDYLIKPFEDIDLISAVVHRAIDRIQLEEMAAILHVGRQRPQRAVQRHVVPLLARHDLAVEF